MHDLLSVKSNLFIYLIELGIHLIAQSHEQLSDLRFSAVYLVQRDLEVLLEQQVLKQKEFVLNKSILYVELLCLGLDLLLYPVS